MALAVSTLRLLPDKAAGTEFAEAVPRAQVLLVDDDVRNLLALREVLEDLADIVSARSGEEALRHLLKQRFAVVILDVLMPGMDGYETARLIRAREQSRDTPIIFLTAINQEDAHTVRGYDLGAVDFVFKPFEPTVVRTKVSVFVKLHEKSLEIEHKARTEQRLLREKLDAQQDRIEAVEALRVSEERQALILSALPLAVYVEDVPNARRFVAGDIKALTGFEPAAFMSDLDLWLNRIHPEDVESYGSLGNRSREFRWLHADGGYRYLLDQSVRLGDVDRGSVAGTLRDVSEQRLMQDQLLQAQKMDAVGKLTGGIAHDFNNLLASVMGGLSLIERHASLEGKAKEILEMTKHAAEQGKHLVSRLLTFSRRQTLAPATVDLTTVARSLRTMLPPMLGGLTELKWETAEDLWPAYADPSQLELAIMNLAINSRDAMPNGGTITVGFANQTAEASEDLGGGHFVVVSVADTGTGIAPDLLPKVIEPFFTTKDVGKGTGLGLSSAYGFARQSGGTLRIRSKPNQGTVVELWLPRASSAASILSAAPPDGMTGRRRNAKVLLIDDNPSLRGLTEMMLVEHGYSVTPAAGGADALALFARQPFDVIVTDYAMPLVSGLDVIRGVRLERPRIPAVIITGYAEIGALDGRPDDVPVLYKPFPSHALVEAIEAVLDGVSKQFP